MEWHLKRAVRSELLLQGAWPGAYGMAAWIIGLKAWRLPLVLLL